MEILFPRTDPPVDTLCPQETDKTDAFGRPAPEGRQTQTSSDGKSRIPSGNLISGGRGQFFAGKDRLDFTSGKLFSAGTHTDIDLTRRKIIFRRQHRQQHLASGKLFSAWQHLQQTLYSGKLFSAGTAQQYGYIETTYSSNNGRSGFPRCYRS